MPIRTPSSRSSTSRRAASSTKPRDETRLETLLRRDRAILLAALAAIVLLACVYLIGFGAMPAGSEGQAMGAKMAGSGSAHPRSIAAAVAPWSAADFLVMLLMWTAMMLGMMTPSAAPMILLYARVGRQAAGSASPLAPAGWFAGGYLLAWTGFAAVATTLQWLLERAMLLTPTMAAASPALGGALLIAAGIYQWTPLKDSCLRQCRAPFQFIQRHGGFQRDRRGALILGLRHGAYCIGCCWGLMLLLFAGGVMNLLWIAALAVLVLAEKSLRVGRKLGRGAGVVLIAAGLAVAAGAF